MATWRTHTFRSNKDMTAFLNGAINVPANLADGLDLDGLTLIIDKDAGGDRTVTFTPKGSLWSPNEIQAQIVAAHADLTGAAFLVSNVGSFHHGKGQIYLKIGLDDGSVYTIRSTGTANTLFGLSAAADTVGTPYTSAEAQVFRILNDQNPWVVVTYK